jgi:hypothetical protein
MTGCHQLNAGCHTPHARELHATRGPWQIPLRNDPAVVLCVVISVVVVVLRGFTLVLRLCAQSPCAMGYGRWESPVSVIDMCPGPGFMKYYLLYYYNNIGCNNM